MLSIDSIKGRSDVKYAFLTVAVLLLVTSAVLAYDYSKAAGGGDNDTAREVVQYGSHSDMFIDKEGYGGGDAKLIYTVVSNPTTDTAGTVKITDMERDPRNSYYTTFPTQVTDGTNTYDVVGNAVKQNGDNANEYIDDLDDGAFKLKYQLNSDGKTVKISGFVYSGASATPVTFPACITIDGKNYPVSLVNNSSFKSALISELTVIVSDFTQYDLSGTKYKLEQTFQGNENITSVKFIVDNDNPNVSDPGETCEVDIKSAFTNCSKLTTLTLPNVLHRADNAFEACTSLGLSESDPLIFNTFLRTKAETDYMFKGCTGLAYVEIGKNVNKMVNTIDSTTTIFSGCSGIKVIYNTSTTITESVIASTILQSGSSNVLLFNNPGGEFTQWASFTTGDGDTNITMPEGTLDGIDIPTWSHKDGFSMYSSGKMYKSFSPWSAIPQEYSHYYYALYGSCTITYNVTYHNSVTDTDTTDTRYQTVVCMYNTSLYDISNYGAEGDTIYDKMAAKADLKWTSSVTIPNTDISYNFGQSLTLYYDLDLYLYLDNITTKDVKVTYTWDYIEKSTDSLPVLKTFTHQVSTMSGEVKTIGSSFKDNAVASDGSKLTDNANALAYFTKEGNPFQRWSASNGTTTDQGSSFYIYDDTNIIAKNNRWYYVGYGYFLNSTALGQQLFIERGSITTISPNLFYTRGGYYFECWNDFEDSSKEYYPGQEISTEEANKITFNAQWKEVITTEDEKQVIPIEYNYNYGESPSSETQYPEYKSSVCLANDVFTPPTGYKLLGWSYTKDGKVNFDLDTPVTMINSLKLYAVWGKDNSLTVIVDNLLLSADALPDDYTPDHTVIGTLSTGDTVEVSVTYESNTDLPTAVGVYSMKVEIIVKDSEGNVVTDNYNISKVSGFLAIYRGDHAAVTD